MLMSYAKDMPTIENAVRTGTFCVYQPETPVEWTC